MRITRETLLRIARSAADERARVSRRIRCIYLTGSLMEEEPLLGGTADVDLVIIYDTEPNVPREIVPVTDEVHLDIAHFAQETFRQPRHLRTDPWLGPFIYAKPLVLFDPQHWFDYIQAATGAQFWQADYTLARARAFAEQARRAWMSLTLQSEPSHARRLCAYLKVVENAGNALVSLRALPLAERRFLAQLEKHLLQAGWGDLYRQMVALLSEEIEVNDEQWQTWMNAAAQAWDQSARQEALPPRLHPARRAYYLKALSALWENTPSAAYWLLLRVWTLAAAHLPAGAPELQSWQDMAQQVGLDKARFAARLEQMDAFLDQVEETLDRWGEAHGASLG